MEANLKNLRNGKDEVTSEIIKNIGVSGID